MNAQIYWLTIVILLVEWVWWSISLKKRGMVSDVSKKSYVQLNLFGEAPKVIVDVHEVSPKKHTSITIFLEKLKSRKIDYVIKKLDIGDIIFPNEYVIERKTIRDFLNSLMASKSGRVRLFEQIKNLTSYENPILLIEGGLSIRLDIWDKAIFVPLRKKPIRNRIYSVIEERIGVHPNAYLGAIKKIEDMGITIIKSYDAIHGASLLWDIFHRANETSKSSLEFKDKYPIVRAKPRLRSIEEQQIFFLCGLPGISYARATKILDVYRNPYNAIMKVRRWDIDINGIGESTLEKISTILFHDFQGKVKEKKR